MSLRDWLRERVPLATRSPATVSGRPSFAYTLGWALVLLLAIEAVTGVALAAFYSPSTTSAWASVAYVQDRVPLGWLVRGLHYHGGSAIVIVCGLHLVQTAVWGAYRRPRELVWWLGIVLILLVLGFAISGYVLRWDQDGYWANQVEVRIAAGTPVIGGAIRRLVLGGNDYGNLTLTRFHALHAIVLPAITLLLVAAHVALARKQGATPWRIGMAATRRWPRQSLRNAIVMAAAGSILLGYVIARHGADLAGPANPASADDPRPLWYFRWLFELRQLAGSFELVAALVVPALVAGFLVALPLADRDPARRVRQRLPWIGGVVGMFAAIGALTVASLVIDGNDKDLADRQAKAAGKAAQWRQLAAERGVPPTGPLDLPSTQPMYRARALFAQRCKGCHDAASKDRKGPLITAGHGNRAWLTAFLRHPNAPELWGKTKLGAGQNAMPDVKLADDDVAALVEMLYAQSGATDVELAKVQAGAKVFKDASCSDCHSIEEGVAGTGGPGLAGLGSRDGYTSFIGNPKSPIHMGPDSSEMPRFDKDMSIVDRDLVADYLTWLRTAKPEDLTPLFVP